MKPELTELPDTWYIQLTEENKEMVRKWHQQLPISYLGRWSNNDYTIDSYFGICKGKQDAWSSASVPTNLLIITDEQFKQLVLKQNKMEKEIIGYKCPTDLYGGKIQKGSIFKINTSNGIEYILNNGNGSHDNYYFPKEIVETWKPVYKEEKIMIGGYEVKFAPNGTYIDGYFFSKEFWEAAKTISEHSKASVYVGCDAKTGRSNMWQVNLEQIEDILTKLNKM